jgi:hypothetical protein
MNEERWLVWFNVPGLKEMLSLICLWQNILCGVNAQLAAPAVATKKNDNTRVIGLVLPNFTQIKSQYISINFNIFQYKLRIIIIIVHELVTHVNQYEGMIN